MAESPSSKNKFSFPHEPIDRLIQPLNRFLHVEAASGLVLLTCALVALGLANSTYSESFLAFWKTSIGFSIGDYQLEHSLKHWINDGLMAIFFFVIGLEIKREIVLGELREFRTAVLPVAAAIGGMVVPAGLYLLVQYGDAGQKGWGIPMATDIAFVVGCLAVLGRRIPSTLRIILLSIAIVDDVGAILVIAFGYTETLHVSWLVMGIVGILLVLVMQRLGVRSIGVYTIVGAAIWVGFHESGIHATIAGVALGLLTPARAYLKNNTGADLLETASELFHGGKWEGEEERTEKVSEYRRFTRETISPLEYLIYMLHPWVAFVIMPIFALANAGIQFQAADVVSPLALAVIAGLLIGKPIGILLASWLLLSTGVSQFPAGMNWRHLGGGAFLAGIGFTMALFITGLAFDEASLLKGAKVGVLFGSLIAAIIGMVILSTGSAPAQEEANE